jgi:hypothetical protein
MLKFVIKFENGDYWYAYRMSGPDVTKAWTFNKEWRAAEHAARIADSFPTVKYTIEPVTV